MSNENDNFIDSAADSVARQLGIDVSSDEKEPPAVDDDKQYSDSDESDHDKKSDESESVEENDEIEDEEEIDEDDPDDEETDEDEPDDEDEDTETPERPKSWGEKADKIWKEMSPEARDQVLKREEDFARGISQYKLGHDYGYAINNIFKDFDDVMPEGLDHAHVLNNLLWHHRQLTTGTDEEKRLALLEIGVASGILKEEELKESGVMEQIEKRRLNTKLDNLENARNAEREELSSKENYDKALEIVNEFAKSHEFFAELEADMVPYLNAGYTLEQAYEHCLWTNPEIRAKHMSKQPDAAPAKKVEKKSKPSGNLPKPGTVRKTKPSTVEAGANESMEDTMRATLAAIRKRSK